MIRDFDIFARYGGDEFVVGLPNTNNKDVNKIAVRIKEKINQVEIETAAELKVSCSIGTVTLNNEHGIENLVDKADRALYKCKNNGGNCVVNYQ